MATIFLTGATSFTGCHIAHALKAAGHRVVAATTRRGIDASDPRVARAGADRWVEEAPFGSERWLSAIREERPAAFVNHGADIKGYRSPDFDYLASVAKSLAGADAVAKALAENGCRRLVHSGSFFEPDEGAPDPTESTPAVSIYGVSKQMVWQPLRFFAERAGLGVSKVVVPDPVGPLENPDRLIPFFVSKWKAGEEPVVRTPDLVRDRVPAPWLARVYAEECAKGGEAGLSVRRPSAYALTNRAFLDLFLTNTGKKSSWKFRLEPVASSEPVERVNREACPELKNAKAEELFWEEWSRSLSL
jgi:nucleoside-diphosphate-sugar epimerase